MTLSEDYENEYPESTQERIRMLEEIEIEIGALVDVASRVIDESGCSSAASRAEAYWIPHIKTALSKDHCYLGGSMCTMDDTIKEMREADEDE